MQKKTTHQRGLFFRYCKECDAKYTPSGRAVRYCDKCWIRRVRSNRTREVLLEEE